MDRLRRRSLTTLSFVPQAWLTLRTRDVSGISLACTASLRSALRYAGLGIQIGVWPWQLPRDHADAGDDDPGNEGLAVATTRMKREGRRTAPALGAVASGGQMLAGIQRIP